MAANHEDVFARWGYRIAATDAGRELLERGCALAPEAVRRERAGALVKRSRTSSVHAVELDSGFEVVYKLDHTRGAADFLKNLVRPSRSRRAWAAFERLRRHGFAVPELLLCGERRVGPVLLGSFLVTRRISGAVPLDELLAGAAAAPAERRRIVADLAALVRLLHERGVHHADLNPANIVVDPRDPRRLVLLDADRTSFRRRVPWRLRRKNIAQLNAHFGSAPLRERLRFLRAYDPAFRLLPRRRRRRLLGEIEAVTRRRWLQGASGLAGSSTSTNTSG
jgi:tRNA A-37 threonylcarbamoyl transferase component Bud32